MFKAASSADTSHQPASDVPATPPQIFNTRRCSFRSLRSQLPVQTLAHTLRIFPQGDWQTHAKKLKLIAPNIKVLIWQPEDAQHCSELLQNPVCNVVRFHTYFASRDPTTFRDAVSLDSAREHGLRRLQNLWTLLLAPVARHAELQLEMTVDYADPKYPPLHAAFNNIAPFIAGLSILGNCSIILQDTARFSHLSRLELTLPDAACAGSDARAVQFLQTVFRSLPRLTYLQLNANSLSIQPSEVTGVLAELPNIISLKVDSGITPCRLAAADLKHVTALCLGRDVDFDRPPAKLQILHLAYLSLAQRPMLLQLRELSSGVELTTECHDAEGLKQISCSHPRCCPHHSLATDHSHVPYEDVAQVTMQPRRYLCDKVIETPEQLAC